MLISRILKMVVGHELQFSNEIDTIRHINHQKSPILQGNAFLTLQTEHAPVKQSKKASKSLKNDKNFIRILHHIQSSAETFSFDTQVLSNCIFLVS